MCQELVINLSTGCKTCLHNFFSVIYHLGNFDDLIPSGFWVIPRITFGNLCKPICDVIIIPVSSDPLNLENVERKERNFKN